LFNKYSFLNFTLKTYKILLKALHSQGFVFQSFVRFLQQPAGKSVILRHDIDKSPANALKTAQIDNSLGISGTYYFRIVPGVWNEAIMKEIVELGHELGYHYEDLSIAKGNHEFAIRHFEKQLEKFRNIYAVKTICMHGSPLSHWDNRDLWKHYNYRDYGIIGEPYFDLDFSKVFYLTDTGRRWDGHAYNIRDKALQTSNNESKAWSISFRHTRDIIKAVNEGNFPQQAMITIHPQRWHDVFAPWLRELVWQNVKNVGKRVLVQIRG
jgi:hypothetical protein